MAHSPMPGLDWRSTCHSWPQFPSSFTLSLPRVDHPTTGTTPYHTYHWSKHLYGYRRLRLTRVPANGILHSPFTYLPRQISIDLNAIETKYVQVPSWPLYHTVPTMSQCRVCIQMQAQQANWCKLLLVATPQPGGRTLHRKACLLWVRPRSHCRSFVNSSGTTLWHYILLLDLSLSSYSQLIWLLWVLLLYHNMTVVLLRVLSYSFGMEYEYGL